MRCHFSLIFLSLFILVTINSCKKSSSNPASGYDIYLSGTIDGTAIYWKNGNPFKLGAFQSYANGITANGKDVYIAGGIAVSDTSFHAVYWKNGIITDLGNGHGHAIAVNGTDVYVGGEAYSNPNEDYAAIWKNGSVTKLGNGGTVSAIAIAGSNVYAGGYVSDSWGVPMATYWKNNVPVSLGQGYVTAIAVSGGDVYTAGSNITGPCYWKNGQVVKQIDGPATINAMTIAGNDVYLAGSVYTRSNVATYWKNGTLVKIPNATALTSIILLGNDVYCTGYYQNTGWGDGNANALFFIKNGITTTLPTIYTLNLGDGVDGLAFVKH